MVCRVASFPHYELKSTLCRTYGLSRLHTKEYNLQKLEQRVGNDPTTSVWKTVVFPTKLTLLIWLAKVDLNHRRIPFQGTALPTELFAIILVAKRQIRTADKSVMSALLYLTELSRNIYWCLWFGI